MTDAWSRWKRLWRRLEHSAPVRRVKRRVRQITGRELRHFVQVRVATERIGGWTLSPAHLARNGVAYSLGVGEDAALDFALVERFGLEVHAFDPTPRAVAWISTQTPPAGFHFHPVGVADFDGVAGFAASATEANPSFRLTARADAGAVDGGTRCEVRRLTTLAREIGHERIELLKMDVEGAEYAVLDDLLASELVVPQLLVEFHHRFGSIGRDATAHAVAKLLSAGYRIFAISPGGREYSFLRSA